MIENFKETRYVQCIGMCLSMYKSVGVVMGGGGLSRIKVCPQFLPS